MLTVATFYQFVDLPDYADRQIALRDLAQSLLLRGTILLAAEGLNATIAGSDESVAAFLAALRQDPRFAGLSVKYSHCDRQPFGQLKVRLKPEIVTFGDPGVNPNHQVGTYVSPQDWNDLIQDPAVTVIDTRNDFEVQIGSFEGAINPQTRSFSDFVNYVQTHLDPREQRQVALFCTGGIRCEKATAYLLQQGFEAVYHLQGGILQYLEQIPEAASLWRGECFVFDGRVSLTHDLEVGHYRRCDRCGFPLKIRDQAVQDPIAQTHEPCPQCDTPSDGLRQRPTP
jgi:UPF0176 protein